MGRPRTPTKLKIIRGTFRKDRSPANEPEPTPVLKIPTPPPGLPPAGRRMWKRLAAELVMKGLLTVVDLEALEAACIQFAIVSEAKAAVFFPRNRKTGKRKQRTLAEYLKGRSYRDCVELTALRYASASLKSYLTEFGLTPASRSRIDVPAAPKEPTKDPMEQLFNEA